MRTCCLKFKRELNYVIFKYFLILNCEKGSDFFVFFFLKRK